MPDAYREGGPLVAFAMAVGFLPPPGLGLDVKSEERRTRDLRNLGGFFSDLRSVLGLGALKRVGRKVLDDDCLGLAGQLAYFFLFSLFPFLIFLVALTGFVLDDPESVLGALTESLRSLLPGDALRLLVNYIDRTLRGAAPSVLFFGVLAAFWSGWAAADAIIKATNRAYDLRETRPMWKLGILSILLVWGFALLVAALALLVFGPQVGDYVRRLTGSSEVLLILWGALRWAMAFLAVTVALSILYYVAPNAHLPFKWITPGGLVATVLMGISSLGLNLYVADFGRYDQIYGQLGAVMVLMLWLYYTGLVVLVGAEMNAVLARMAEERKGVELVRPEPE
jgi:membrane protein